MRNSAELSFQVKINQSEEDNAGQWTEISLEPPLATKLLQNITGSCLEVRNLADCNKASTLADREYLELFVNTGSLQVVWAGLVLLLSIIGQRR
ncbi:hypothetical protein E2542_SST02953 [Spatholobus suberectus]|nr:hypothetical protein E2542_SST02953 [Spatholobus suberectus]